ncbi:MAG: hypothetical protein NXI24_02050 [bacterium]|nr:hypothetical protein [bacterium]
MFRITICLVALGAWTACAVRVLQIPPPVSEEHRPTGEMLASETSGDAEADSQPAFYFLRDFQIAYNQSLAHRGISRWIEDDDAGVTGFQEFYRREMRKQLELRIENCPAPGSGALDARLLMTYYEPSHLTVAGLPAYYPFVAYWPLQIVEGRFTSRIELRFESGERRRIDESFRERLYFYGFFQNDVFEHRIRNTLQTLFQRAAQEVCER